MSVIPKNSRRSFHEPVDLGRADGTLGRGAATERPQESCRLITLQPPSYAKPYVKRSKADPADVFAIRSERAICREVQVNLADRWFCGLSVEDRIPDHSALTRAQ